MSDTNPHGKETPSKGRGKGYRATREAHATEDAWKEAVNEAIDDMDDRIGALEAAGGTGGEVTPA